MAALLPCPVGVQLRGPDECEMNAEGAMDPGTVDADKDAVGDRGPSWILGPAIEANLEYKE